MDDIFELNDRLFSAILSEDNSLRMEASREIFSYIKTNNLYLINLLDYVNERIDSIYSKLSFILIGKIILYKPQFFLENFIEFGPRLQLLIDKTKNNIELQRLIGHIISCSVTVIKNKSDTSDQLIFFENLFLSCQNDLDTNPICFFILNCVDYFPNFDKTNILLVLYNIICECYPKNNDFLLLKDSIQFFCHYSSMRSEFDENYEHLFSAILELAQSSSQLEVRNFNYFWCSIQEININKSGPFLEIALDFLQNAEDYEYKVCLFDFIEYHSSLILSDQVEPLINIFFDTIFNLTDINISNFSLLSSLSVVDFSTFDVLYKAANEVLNQDHSNQELIYIYTIWTMLDKYQSEFIPYISDILNICIKIFENSLENEYLDNIENIISLFVDMMRIYPDDEFVKKIPEYLLGFINSHSNQKLDKIILNAIACSIPEIDKQEFFNKLLQLFCEQYNSITPKTASFYFYALSCYLPNSPLIPENMYQSVQDLVEYYLEFLKTKKTICFTLSIFIFNMYLHNPKIYSDLLKTAIRNLCYAYSQPINVEIINQSCQALLTYIDLFKFEAFPLPVDENYYIELYENLTNNEKNISNFTYIMVLFYICYYDKSNFDKFRNFSRYLIESFLKKRARDFQTLVKCITMLLYRFPNLEIVDKIINRIYCSFPTSIHRIDTDQLTYSIDIYSSLIRPSSIAFWQSKESDYKIIVAKVIEISSEVLSKLMAFSIDSSNNFKLFFNIMVQIGIILCPHNCPIIHDFFKKLFPLFNIDNDEMDLRTIDNEIKKFLQLGNEMMDYHIIDDDEIKFIVLLYHKILTNPEYTDLYEDAFVSVSHLVLINTEPFIQLMEIIYEHWRTSENEYVLNILSIVFLRIFVKMRDQFNQEDIIEIASLICDRFQPFAQNCGCYLQSSLDFLVGFPDIPDFIKEKFLRNFITYISYQKFCYFILEVKEETHQRLLEYLRILIPELERSQEIIESCFPDSPQLLSGALEMIGITYEPQ